MKYGLIGEKLGHSFSEEIHEEIGKYKYELVELSTSEFHYFMTQKDFKAINVTIPYKEKVLPYLNYVSPEAQKINAVNTIVNKNGYLYGYNTDYLGLKEMINHFNIDINNKKVMILGTGGTSKTAYQVVKDLNASSVIFVSTSKKDGAISYQQIDEYCKDIDVLINTTPKEMYPNIDKEIIESLDNFKSLSAVIDVIYNPIRTSLTLKAKEKKIKYCNGLFMLVAQAFYAIEIFVDKPLKKEVLGNVYNKLVKEKENIVLIGMPSSGKTTVAKELSKALKKKAIDVDKEIIKMINMPISVYFKKYGEEAFRRIESDVIKELSKKNGIIIATGGGSILKKENIDLLKRNGKIFLLDRPLELLKVTNDRPLSSTLDTLKQRYQERKPIYLKACDVKIDASKDIKDVVEQIIKEI